MERIAIVDWDVHHGNGTQEIFWSDTDMFYGSTHEMPLFPGTGAISERGVGNICNAPLRAGDGGAAFHAALEERILPALNSFGPDLILVSAGFDAHQDDPIGGMRLTDAGFAALAQRVRDVATEVAAGRLVAVLEGGYDPGALGRCVATVTRVLDGLAPDGYHEHDA